MTVEEIHILHHTHVDVGYTDLQPVVCEKHVDFIDQALDLCTTTDSYPEEAKFRWINEFSWPVMQYIKQRPERVEELVKRCCEGRVELCGLFLDPTELCDRRSFEASLQPALSFSREHGVPLTTVMTTDIPGQGWSLADVIVEQGLRYLSVSPNSMVSKPILVERPFYWIGPKGNRVLVWLTDWRKGWYGEGHLLGFPRGFEVARSLVIQYLELLTSEEYPWKVLALHMAADNYPPFEGLSDLVARWNQEGSLPKMSISTNREFFERLSELHEGAFASHRAAWPDWWANGIGSAAYEVALSRETHCRVHRIEALKDFLGDKSDTWPIFEDLLLFDEHTWGCSNMALDSYSFNSRASWAYKSAHIYRAADAARRMEARLAGSLCRTREFVVFNPLSEDYVGPVEVPREAKALTARGEEATPVQRSPATPLAAETAWAVVRVLPKATRTWSMAASGEPEPPGVTREEEHLQNEFYRISFDPGSGLPKSIVDRETGIELLDNSSPHRFAETIHESIAGRRDRNAIWERGQTEIPYGKRRTDAPFVRRGAGEGAKLLSIQHGPVFDSLTWQSRLPNVRRLETEVWLWHGLRRIDAEVRMDKRPWEKYEGLYVAFPFALSEPRAFIHNAGATFEAEAQQLPGTCRDFYAVEHFVAVEGNEGWAALSPVEAPLVQLGQINTGRWLDHLSVERACIYSWLMNNFWYTNFPGYQQGVLRFRFALTTGRGALSLGDAERFGKASRVGLVVTSPKG